MKLKVCSLQIGVFEGAETGESYMKKHIDLLERAVAEETEKEGGKPYICLLPETMTYAYFGGVVDDKWFDLFEDAHEGPTVKLMEAEAKKLGVHLIYGFCEKAKKFGVWHYYNSAALISPTRGLIGLYRKCHMPHMDTDTMQVHETYYFEPGDVLPVYKLDNGVTIGMLLCFDRSFPLAWNTLYLQGAQMVFVPACAWGFRGVFFQNELRCRAWETHTFVVAANRVGDEQIENERLVRNHFGKSMIAAPNGDLLAALEDEKWGYVSAICDLDEIEKAHITCNFKSDRRPELYGICTAAGSFAGPYIHTHNKL